MCRYLHIFFTFFSDDFGLADDTVVACGIGVAVQRMVQHWKGSELGGNRGWKSYN